MCEPLSNNLSRSPAVHGCTLRLMHLQHARTAQPADNNKCAHIEWLMTHHTSNKEFTAQVPGCSNHASHWSSAGLLQPYNSALATLHTQH